MNPYRWARLKARTLVDSWYSSSAPGITRVGCADSGWVIQTIPPPRIAYCAGVGKGISFELELARVASKPVLVFDPSPTGIATIEALGTTPNIEFLPVGLAAEKGVVEFSVPRDAEEGSYAVAQDGLEHVRFECWDLKTIMDRQGDSSIDLLKMDIEGFEFDIVEQVLDQKIPVRQLCVEFHPWLKPGRIKPLLARLRKHGYSLIHKQRGDYTFLLK